MSQEHYWKEFFRLKVHVCYLELQLEQTEKTDRTLKIFLALASSASIGGWAVWKELAAFWGGVIALSQVSNAVRQYLPYKERIRALSGLLSDLEELQVQVESKWLDISAGELSEVEIRKALGDLRVRRMRSFRKHFPEKTIPESKKLFMKAEEKTVSYFNNFYSEEK